MIEFILLLVLALIVDYFIYARLKPLAIFSKKNEIILVTIGLAALLLGLVIEKIGISDFFTLMIFCSGMVITRFFDAMNLSKERNQLILFKYLLEIMLVFCIITQFAFIWNRAFSI